MEMAQITMLYLILACGIAVVASSATIVYKTHIYRKIHAQCIYSEKESVFSDDAMGGTKGYRCRFVYEYNGIKHIVVEKGRRTKITAGQDYAVYVSTDGNDIITKYTAETSICRLVAGVALIICCIIRFALV